MSSNYKFLDEEKAHIRLKNYKFIDEGKKHVHTLNGEPLYGTSTVVGILNKPLTWWAAGMAVGTLGWTATQSDPDMRVEVAKIALEGLKDLTPAEYLKRLDLAYKAHNEKKKDSAEAGTDMHTELEKYVLKMISDQDGKPLLLNDADEKDETWERVQKFAKWAHLNIERFLFAEAHTYSEKYWLGGIVDCGARMKDGRMALLDFKSSKEAYYSQMVQIAGYALQIEESGTLDADGNQTMLPMPIDELVVVTFGSGEIKTRAAQNIEGFKRAFIGCLENYKLSKAFEEK